MDRYTYSLMNKGKLIDPADDDYVEKLQEVARSFRSFNDALTEFLVEKGYDGPVNDAEAKTGFLKGRYKEAGIKPNRDIKKWFSESKRIERTTAFPLCFAFHLSLSETEEFFRKVILERGIDCHDIEEAVYHFCIRTGRTYEEAQQIIGELPKNRKGEINFSSDVLYTASIVEEITRMEKPEELICYIREHIENFGYNNVTACQTVKNIWQEITKEDGLAQKEREISFRSSDSKENREPSVWEMYLQILGINKEDTKGISRERTIRPVIVGSNIIHELAGNSFPDRSGIHLILQGKHISYERIRKILILLLFYRYWVKRAVKKTSLYYQAGNGDGERCIAGINQYLLEAGYPMLYYGNPYDWIYLYASMREFPLLDYRAIIQELFFFYEEHKKD